MIKIGNLLFRYRNGLFPFACLFILLPGAPLLEQPFVAAAVGFLIAVCGQGVRVATIGLEYVIRGGRNRRVYAEGLVTGGLYRLSRNPMYVGNLLILTGLAISTNSWTCVALAVPLFMWIYVAIVSAEEDYLGRRFGAAFDLYCADVPRWLPRGRDLATWQAFSGFHWRRVLVKEYGTPVGWITMMVLMLFWRLRHENLIHTHEGLVVGVLAAFAALLILFLRVRSLKLTRRLVAD